MTGSNGDERGFTLVELLVSMTIIVMTLLGSLYVAIGYFRTSHDTFSRSTGIQVASEQMETMKAVGWADLGFYVSDSAPTCPASLPCTGQAAAPSLGTTRPTGAAAPVPLKTVTRGNVTFTVTSYITSVTTPATADAARRIVVKVTWTIRGRAMAAQIDALRSPVFAEISGTSSSSTPTTAPTATPTATPTASAPAGLPVTSVVPTSSVCLNIGTPTSTSRTTSGFVLRVTATNATALDDVVIKWAGNTAGFANAVDGTPSGTSAVFDVAIPASTSFSGTVPGNNDSGNFPVTVTLTRAYDGVGYPSSGLTFPYTAKNNC